MLRNIFMGVLAGLVAFAFMLLAFANGTLFVEQNNYSDTVEQGEVICEYIQGTAQELRYEAQMYIYENN